MPRMCCRFSCEAYTIVSPSCATFADPVNSSVFVKRPPHWESRRLTTFRSSPWASSCAPWVERKCTWVSPLKYRSAFRSDHRLSRSVSSRCPGLDVNALANRLVLEPPCHVHVHLAPGQPPLALAVDVGVGHLAQGHVAAHVHVPSIQVRVYVGMVAVGRVGHALCRPEMYPARYGLARLVVQHRGVHPVPARVDDLEPDRGRLDDLFGFQLAPVGRTDRLPILFYGYGGRRCAGHAHVGGTGATGSAWPQPRCVSVRKAWSTSPAADRRKSRSPDLLPHPGQRVFPRPSGS